MNNYTLNNRQGFPFPSSTDLDDLMRNINTMEKPATGYPFFDIYSTAEHTFIDFALAGFTQDEISVTVDDGRLVVEGEPTAEEESEDIKWRKRGISRKSFRKVFPLVEYAEVEFVKYVDGLLTIALYVNVPEDKKPRTFEIGYTKLLGVDKEE